MSSTTELNYKELYEQLLKEHKELYEEKEKLRIDYWLKEELYGDLLVNNNSIYKKMKELEEALSKSYNENILMSELIQSEGLQDELPELFCDDEEEEDLSCIKCKTKIKENSKEHDYCILVNEGENLLCVDCADCADDYIYN